jgi:putative endopeptidase
MDDTTRQRALGKKAAIVNKIGYPDKWRDYSKLKLKKGDYFGNLLASSRFEFEREANKIGKPVDRTEWGMTPPTVNAYYNPLNNEMVFPAGILQPPFFSKDFPMAMNFGGMGMVMGHELTHGFDDQGRKFDATGKLTEWWEPAVSDKFEERASCIDKQYSGYEVQPGLHLNGKLTLGENIADNGGIKETYTAYKAWEAKTPGAEKPIVEGLTNDQLLFVAFAQTWCSLATPQIEQMLVTIDPHSPPRFRVNGPLSNTKAFADAFSCPAGTPMHPKDTCEVW